jgi:hypothetical protein
MCFRGFKYQNIYGSSKETKKFDKNIKDFVETNS